MRTLRRMVSHRRLWPVVLALTGCSGSDDPAGPGPQPPVAPVVESFLVTDPTVTHGLWTSLRWRIPGATVASVSPGVGPVSNPANGAVSIRPFQDTQYTITASNSHGTVTATVDVGVRYLAGIFVDSVDGDDSRSGESPPQAVRTLAEALLRTQGGGAIFLAGGIYDTSILIDGAEHSIFGGLNPETFFAEPDVYPTRIRPTTAMVPLTVRNANGGVSLFSVLELETFGGGSVAADIENSNVVFEDCRLDAKLSATGTALLAHGISDVQAFRCRILGGRRVSPHSNTRGAAVLDGTSLLLHSCFVDGGAASTASSGVDVSTTGTVRLGFNTISAQLTGAPGADVAAAVRIRAGRPALGGNILFTRWTGNVEHHAIVEESADADPSWLMGNLFITPGVPPYDNYSSDGPDPTTEEDLNEAFFVNDESGTVFLNELETAVGPEEVFANPNLSDYHLLSPLPTTLGPNPAVDQGDALLLDVDRFGASGLDIDRGSRPGTATRYDLGADEH